MRNLLKVTLVVALALGLTVAFAPKAKAFHDDGVAKCNGCHTMHDSYQGTPMSVSYDVTTCTDPNDPTTCATETHEGPWSRLLRGETESDTCLRCHSGSRSYTVMSGSTIDPHKASFGAGGGDFAYLLSDKFGYEGHSGCSSKSPDRAGHNIIAPSKGTTVDGTFSDSPLATGGSVYPANAMTCASCHDPHGGKQFRFLYWSGAKDATSHSKALRTTEKTKTFTNDEVRATEIAVSATERDDLANAYLANMSQFCAQCHNEAHNQTNKHATDQALSSAMVDKYWAYNGTEFPNGSGDTGGTDGEYLALVPVQWDDVNNTTDHATKIGTTAKVMCVTCHRAHASSNDSAGRWEFNATIWEEYGPAGGGADACKDYVIPSPYGAGVHQRSLCNKCHVQDDGDF